MIDILTESEVFTPKFGGNDKADEPITVTIRRPKESEYWMVLTLFDALNKKIGSEYDDSKAVTISALSDKLKPVLKSIVTNVSGVRIDGKNSVDGSVFMEYPELHPYMFEIVSRILDRVSLSAADKKKSDSP